MSRTTAVEHYCRLLTPGGLFVGDSGRPAMISAVLGTAAAVCLHDRRLKMGGMTHFLYPTAGLFGRADSSHATVAIPALIKQMIAHGCRPEDLEAQIFGGAEAPGPDSAGRGLGTKNVKMARKILRKNRVPVVSEDVGGRQGRRIIFYTGANEALVMKTHWVRRGDFFPYRQREPGTR